MLQQQKNVDENHFDVGFMSEADVEIAADSVVWISRKHRRLSPCNARSDPLINSTFD